MNTMELNIMWMCAKGVLFTYFHLQNKLNLGVKYICTFMVTSVTANICFCIMLNQHRYQYKEDYFYISQLQKNHCMIVLGSL